jgi:hypothetical protein
MAYGSLTELVDAADFSLLTVILKGANVDITWSNHLDFADLPST